MLRSIRPLVFTAVAFFTGAVRGADPVIVPVLETKLAAAPGERHRVWVFFTDKRISGPADLDLRIQTRERELSASALRRRSLRGTKSLDETDIALAAEYVRAVTATGARPCVESRWLNAMSIEATAPQIRQIAALPFVSRTQPVARAARRLPLPIEPGHIESSSLLSPGSLRGTPAWYGASFNQLNQIGIPAAHDAGYDGSDIVVGVLDTGFNRTHNAFNQTTGGAHPVQIVAEHDFVANDNNTAQQPGDPENQASHGTYILGTLGAFQPGLLVGSLYNASFILAKTEDISQEVPAEEDHYVAGLEWLEAQGADMATSSLGYIDWYTQSDLDGQTAVTTIAVNIAIANGLVCCTAAGNQGHDSNPATSYLLAPSDAFKVLSCGAVDVDGLIAGFSSDGPTADGRVKPEVLARGVNTQTVRFTSDTEITGVDGTSLSTPLVAGGIALIIEAHPDWSVDQIRRAMFHTAGGFEIGATFDPQFVRGYGIIDVMGAIQFVHGDINGDGTADARDIPRFIAALLGTNPDANERRRADLDASGAVTPADVPILTGDLLGL